MQFIDLKFQQGLIRGKIDANIKKVLDHGKYIMGPEIFELEERLAEFVDVKHCIGVSSGTDALLVTMMALGIKAGDEVITTPFTFIATGEMIALLGAKPVFVDIDPRTYNIDPNKIESAITLKTKAIMPVSLYGQCADMDAINTIAAKYGLPVIEDGAQSLGATYKGKQSCALSTIGCTSFFPSKPLGGYGDSGACFTDDDNLAKIMREIRVHGQDKRYHHPRVGLNGRMDTLQAAVLLAKLDLFPEEVNLRKEIGSRYTKLLSDAQSEDDDNMTSMAKITPPYIEPYNTSVYAQYTVQVSDRETLLDKLKLKNIPTAVHYPVPLNKQPALSTDEFDLSISEELSGKVMSLPMHPYLEKEDQASLIRALVN
jgi:UDP-2-acetamido-2-deoxy-ribo-hexuluronate aminotransferase